MLRSTLYLDRYNKFMNALKNQVVEGYTEKHHIVPRSHGGTHDESNIIRLTPRQHYVAHWMLWKAYGKEMTTAFNYMNGIKRYGKRLNSKTFEILKIEEIQRQKNKVFSEETRKKMSEAAKARPPASAETNRKIVESRKGYTHSEETRRKLSVSHTGKKWSQSSIEKRLKTYYANRTPEKWMNKDGVKCKVKVEDVDKYLQLGYSLGQAQVISEETRKKLKDNAKIFWQKKKSKENEIIKL
jgi:hypothetical protein